MIRRKTRAVLAENEPSCVMEKFWVSSSDLVLYVSLLELEIW